jgi:hypothetical protein
MSFNFFVGQHAGGIFALPSGPLPGLYIPFKLFQVEIRMVILLICSTFLSAIDVPY